MKSVRRQMALPLIRGCTRSDSLSCGEETNRLSDFEFTGDDPRLVPQPDWIPPDEIRLADLGEK